jgi:hypothetical protein
METLDFRSLTDDDLDRRIAELDRSERAISRERRLLHEYLKLLGVDRHAQTTGVPFSDWVARLVARENEVSYERSLIQARLDILVAMKRERSHGRPRSSLGFTTLVNALSRNARRARKATSEPGCSNAV